MVDHIAKAKIDIELAKAKVKVIEAKKRHAELEQPVQKSNPWEDFFD